ncbi:MAG TPA: hypothetical protein VLA19_07295, partial [Herpetosiphonaceae bacterium]|nr:hypothetical protein [Herpetosiphonaceae bacterium]
RSWMKTVTSALLALTLGLILVVPALAQPNAQQFPAIQVPPGYTIEKVVDKLTYVSSLTFDDQGRMYVVEAGGQFLEEPPPARILRIENGQATEVANLTAKGAQASVVGIVWHQGAFYFTHRDMDRTGAVSRMTMDGTVTKLFSGIIDSQSEHQVNSIAVGPDGRMYVASGPAGNAAVIGIDNAPFVERSPMVHTTSCQDIVLTGQNFMTPDFRTPAPNDTALTGAYVPFGTPTDVGQRIQGTNKCGGSILVFDPNNAEATLRPYVHGLRNVIDMTWNKSGEMFAAVNGYDVRGSRPFNDNADPTYRIREGKWYGYPDFSALGDPITDPKFELPDALKVPVVVNGQMIGRPQNFVIDHAASGLQPPDKSLVFGRHELGSSPSGLDVAPDSWGDVAGQVFVAEWGDLAPGTSPLRERLPGYQITRINPATGLAEPFIRNVRPGPGSMQGAAGMAIERPFDMKFGPDGAMYIADYGAARVNLARIREGQVPYEFPPETGAIWRVTRSASAPAVQPLPPQQPPLPVPPAPGVPPSPGTPPEAPAPAPPAAPAPAPPGGLPNTGVEGAPLNFPETGYSVSGEFLKYWRANGALPVFGYPIDSERQVDGQVAQWFERNRFELHAENNAPYNVLLGRLGAEALERQGVDWQSLPKADASAPHYFKETGQAIAPQFWNYYRSHGLEFGDRGVSAREALALFGYPISPARMETNAEGHTVLTQWFERARFEYHPNNAAQYKVLLGRLGAQVRNERGR